MAPPVHPAVLPQNRQNPINLTETHEQVLVEPTNIPDTISILRGLRQRYEAYHGMQISEGALMAAATLSQRYISGRHLPDKAIDCLDEAAAQVGGAGGGDGGKSM
jgi:ATP-dependent Clp protease ATP-binding subunit ClpB